MPLKFFRWLISQLSVNATFDGLKWVVGWIVRMVLSASIFSAGAAAVLALLDRNVTFGVAVSIFCVALVSLTILRFVDPLALAQTAVLWTKRESVVQQSESSSEVVPGGPSIKASVVVVTPTQLERERDQALLALADCKRSSGIAQLQWLAYQFRVNIEKSKLDGHVLKNAHVTVRFAPPYDDGYTLAEEIKKIMEQYTRWPVEIDGTNNPLIRPNDEFRVIFESSWMNTFREVESAFREGELIKGHLGCRSAEREDHEHLIIEVPPQAVKQ